jgi:hypothetical protein
MAGVTSFDIAFRGWLPTWLAAIAGLASLAGVAWLYARESGRLPVAWRVALAAVRGLLLVSILFLALRPTVVRQGIENRRRPVVLLVDESQSMRTLDTRSNAAERFRVAVALDLAPHDKPLPPSDSADPGPIAGLPEKISRTDLVRAVLKHPKLNLLSAFATLGPLQPAGFGGRRVAKDGRDPKWPEAIANDEPRTAIADAVLDLLQRDEADRPAAIVLMTDGRDNAGSLALDELARRCEQAGVPLHIYGVGSSAYGTLQVRDVAVPETLFADDTVAVPLRYRVKGFAGGQAEVTVKLNGRVVAEKRLTVREGDDLRELLAFVPKATDVQPGKQELTTTVRLSANGEIVSDDVTKSVRVVDRKIRVLVVDNEPRWDFKFLQRALLRDRRVEANFYLANADSAAMKAGPPFISSFPQTRPELFGYDLVVLGDLPAGLLAPDQKEALRDFVAEGGGLICIAGRQHAPAGFVNTPLADVLPVEITPQAFAVDAAGQAASFTPRITGAGQRSPLLALADDPAESLKVWQELPAIYWHYPVTKLKPAAEALLVHPEKKTENGQPMPLLATHSYGKGFAIFQGFDETWRWRFNAADKYFGRFWSQAIYAAGVPRTLGTKLTQLSLDTPDPLLGRTGQIYARLFAPDLRPLAAERLEARLERLDAAADDPDRVRPVELKALPGQPGEFIASVPFNRVGKFAFKVDAGADAASLEYRVGLPADHELAPGGLAEDEMRKLAVGSGGTFHREDELHLLTKSLKPQSYPITMREEILLWNVWSFGFVVMLLTLEWVLRKANGLS